MKKITILIVLAALCLNFRLHGQSLLPATALHIGDTVPQRLWRAPLSILNHPRQIKSTTLQDYRGKLIILDFWATWCTSCIHHLPDVNRLQKAFPDELQVILVNTRNSRDTRQKIENFFSRINTDTATATTLFSVVDDVALDKAFYHLSIPHYVWIDHKGMIRAFTSAEEVTSANIRLMLSNDIASTRVKLDINRNRPIYTTEEFPLNQLQKFSLLLKGQIDGAGGGSRQRTIDGEVRGRSFNNRTLVSLYTSVAYHKIKDFCPKQLIISAGDSALLFPPANADLQVWNRDNFYTFELILPKGQSAEFDEVMLKELNASSGFTATLEHRSFNCLQLQKIEPDHALLTHGGERSNKLDEPVRTLANSPVGELAAWLNEQLPASQIVLNNAGEEMLDFYFSGNTHELNNIQKNLARAGLRLVPIKKELACMVLRRSTGTTPTNSNSQ